MYISQKHYIFIATGIIYRKTAKALPTHNVGTAKNIKRADIIIY